MKRTSLPLQLRRLVQKWSIQPRWPLLALGAILLCAIEPAFAQPTVRRGLIFVRVHCSQCHAIDKVGESPLAIAPPFRTLRLRYPVADLQRPLLEGNPSRDAPISAHAWSGVGYDGVSPNAQSLSALSSLSLKGASSRKSQLMAALRQHARPIVIGDAELGRPFRPPVTGARVAPLGARTRRRPAFIRDQPVLGCRR